MMQPSNPFVVGVVGLGKMGLPIARHIGRKGYSVIGFDLAPDAVKAASAQGTETASDLNELLDRCNLVLVVTDTESSVSRIVEAARDRWAGDSLSDRVVVVLATIRVTAMRQLERLAEEGGFALLDGPLCKGEQAAVDGSLLLMGGGDRATYERCVPVFSAFARDQYLLGPLGSGQAGKLVNNLVLWASMAVTSEGFWLAEKLGADLHTMREALLKSSGRTWALETWYRPRDMPWATKDMTMVLAEADAVGLSLPLAGVLHEVIKSVKERGRPASTRPAGTPAVGL